MSIANIIGVPHGYRLAKRGETYLLQALHYLHDGANLAEQWIDLPTMEEPVPWLIPTLEDKLDISEMPIIEGLEWFTQRINDLEARLDNTGKLLEESDKEVTRLSLALNKSEDRCQDLSSDVIGLEHRLRHAQ